MTLTLTLNLGLRLCRQHAAHVASAVAHVPFLKRMTFSKVEIGNFAPFS